jgi:hypothetical protein
MTAPNLVATTSASNDAGMGLMFFVMGLFVLVTYFLPTFIALSRKKANAGAIFALNAFLGWSLIGWVVALVWSLTVDRKDVIIQQSFAAPQLPQEKL